MTKLWLYFPGEEGVECEYDLRLHATITQAIPAKTRLRRYRTTGFVLVSDDTFTIIERLNTPEPTYTIKEMLNEDQLSVVYFFHELFFSNLFLSSRERLGSPEKAIQHLFYGRRYRSLNHALEVFKKTLAVFAVLLMLSSFYAYGRFRDHRNPLAFEHLCEQPAKLNVQTLRVHYK